LICFSHVQPIASLEIEQMRWQNPVSRAAAAAVHTYPRAAAAAAASAIAIHTYPRAEAAATTTTTTTAAAAAAAAIALKFHLKHEKRQNLRQNETHYDCEILGRGPK
jgi:ADP-ribosylglycohydrolase